MNCGRVFNNKEINIYRIIILPAVLYGSETWSLTLSEERRLILFVLECCGEYLYLKGSW